MMAARSHYWHLHLVATSEQSLPVLLLLGWLQRRRKGASIRSQCAQLSADHRAKSSKSRISAGSGTEQRQPPLHYRTLSGKALSNLEPVACASGQIYSFSLGYTSSWGCSADLRTELWCVQRQPVSCSSHDNAGERTRTAPSICGPFNSQLPRAVAKPLTSKLRSHYGEIYSARSRRCMDFSRILCTTRFWRGQVGCWRPFSNFYGTRLDYCLLSSRGRATIVALWARQHLIHAVYFVSAHGSLVFTRGKYGALVLDNSARTHRLLCAASCELTRVHSPHA